MKLFIPTSGAANVQRDCQPPMDGLCAAVSLGMPPRKKAVRQKKAAPASVGLTAAETPAVAARRRIDSPDRWRPTAAPVSAATAIRSAAQPLLLAALPIDRVEPTPYQRDLSDAHVKQLMGVIDKIGRFLDPIIAIRADGQYWTPNGHHRLQAMRRLGVKTVDRAAGARAAGRVQDPRAQHREGAQPAREIARDDPHGARAGEAQRRRGRELRVRVRAAGFLTLGMCYEERPRLSGGAYQSILRRVDTFLDEPIGKAIKERERAAGRSWSSTTP